MVRIYEEHAKAVNPHTRTITYDVQDLFNFLDNMGDISCLMCVGVAA